MRDTEELIISSSPYIKDRLTISKLMWHVSLALMPAVFASIYFFGTRAIRIILVCIIASILTDWIFLKFRKRKFALTQGSSLLTGLLLALTLPPTIPLGIACLGSVAAIILGKQIFGGLGYNIFNPALIGRAFLVASFPVLMTNYIQPLSYDAITTATPLGLIKFEHISTSVWSLFIGNIPGSLGETSALVLIIGGLYLLLRGYIDWRIPTGIILSVSILGSFFFFLFPAEFPNPLFHIFSGGLLLGTFFMAIDPVTSPITRKGRWIFGISIGILIIIIRHWSGLPEGVMYSILFMNAFTPLINRFTKPRRFGV